MPNAKYVNWDDPVNFLNNPRYRGLGVSQLKWMFTTFHMGHYIPVTWITFGLDYLLWGMDPAGYHLTSLLLHAATALAHLVAEMLGFTTRDRIHLLFLRNAPDSFFELLAKVFNHS